MHMHVQEGDKRPPQVNPLEDLEDGIFGRGIRHRLPILDLFLDDRQVLLDIIVGRAAIDPLECFAGLLDFVLAHVPAGRFGNHEQSKECQSVCEREFSCE